MLASFIADNVSPWVKLLTNALESLNVEIVEGEPFLGMGAYGRVFHVRREEDYALKLVPSM
ncbi:hypothetical protein THRCLA_22008 [Thraustotheca clavata]|uniref:Protein kinase domain-containing protein n=1 Tax=Thraustotheca clavata TaxID=74557 RepID=A0A1V9ZEB6_9STRA|nr:hypothetical protein THRCLA_22008 [Thraustotheca clavata]